MPGPVTTLFEHATDTRSIPAGAAIYREGDPRDCMYVVREGEVDLLVRGQRVETVERGGIFGEMALIEKCDRLATAVARTDATIVPVDEQQFLFLVHETPNFALHVMRVLSDRLMRLGVRVLGD